MHPPFFFFTIMLRILLICLYYVQKKGGEQKMKIKRFIKYVLELLKFMRSIRFIIENINEIFMNLFF